MSPVLVFLFLVAVAVVLSPLALGIYLDRHARREPPA